MILFFILSIIRRLGGSGERELLNGIRTRDERSFEALYDRYAPLLFSLIQSIVKNRVDAEDLLQETFVQIWDKAEGFDETKGTVYSWVVALARNRAIDRIRSRSFRDRGRTAGGETVEAAPNPGLHSPLDILIDGEQAARVRNALASIPQEQREVITIAYFQGLSQSEIASTTQIPLGTVKTRMRQGMKKLHALLAEGL